jgi:hypothetical protein
LRPVRRVAELGSLGRSSRFMKKEEPQKSATEAAGYIAGVGIGAAGSVLPNPCLTRSHIIAAALFVCWALLLSARTIAAAIYATAGGTNYEMGLEHIGWLLPTSAWFCFCAAIVLLVCSLRRHDNAA